MILFVQETEVKRRSQNWQHPAVAVHPPSQRGMSDVEGGVFFLFCATQQKRKWKQAEFGKTSTAAIIVNAADEKYYKGGHCSG